MKRENIDLVKRDLESSLWIRCFPFHSERVLDNPLHNASNAIAEEGAGFSVQSYRKDPWAVVEIIQLGKFRKKKNIASFRRI